MLKKGDIVKYDDTSPDAWSERKGSIGIVTCDEYRSDERNKAVAVSPISTTSDYWPKVFSSSVWKKIGHSE